MFSTSLALVRSTFSMICKDETSGLRSTTLTKSNSSFSKLVFGGESSFSRYSTNRYFSLMASLELLVISFAIFLTVIEAIACKAWSMKKCRKHGGGGNSEI